MGMFRSEIMQHGTLVLPADRARDFIEMLGSSTHIQFVDMNAHTMKRPYRKYVQRIDEMERILRFLFDEIKKLPGAAIMSSDIDDFIASNPGYQLEEVEASLQKLHHQFRKFQENNLDLTAQKTEAIEARAVARAALSSLEAAGSAGGARNVGDTEDPAARIGDSVLGFANMAGVIASSEQDRFARTIFRATRGNAFTHFESIPDPVMDVKTGKLVLRSVFVIYFQAGVGTSTVRSKISRICQAYGVTEHQWPRSVSEARSRLAQLEEEIADKTKAVAAYEEYFVAESATLLEGHRPNGGSLLDDYRLFCLKEKSIYATLNLFEGEEATLRADCWLPKAEEESIRRLLMKGATPSQASAFLLTDKTAPRAAPPTYIPTTEFTAVFQSFVDTYGIPRYQEANPGLLTIMTFPFLFGIMYGDIGHGACVLAFGLFLVAAWDKIKTVKDEMVQMIGGGRYMIVLMGLFAVYAGFLYNDFFSLGIDIFGTRYVVDSSIVDGDQIHYKFDDSRTLYPFGFDPAWKGATNELLFTNSFKMKFALIVGFVQMTTGIFLKGMNTIYFKDKLTFIFEFIPQLVFMLALVGFMDFLIFLKWSTTEELLDGKSNKPLVITNIIEMCMLQKPELVAFRGQGTVQTVCFLLMILSVPLMLLPKPLILRAIHSRKAAALKQKQDIELDTMAVDEEPFDFGEEMIHQMIETIEFVLGTISNTASYLRLWALSLAHQQLALVFFNMLIQRVLKMDMNAVAVGIILFFVFAIFSAITFGVMLCMDTLECFLHALRLQWVEFQNKFYKADGYAFEPFSFKRTLAGGTD